VTSIRFDHPELLWLLLLAAPIVWLGMRSLAQLDSPRKWTAIGLRLAVLLVLVLMLAGLQSVQRHSELTVMAAIDHSQSMRYFARPPQGAIVNGQPATDVHTWIDDWVGRAAMGSRRQGDRLGVVNFDGRPTVRTMPSEIINLDTAAIHDPVEGADMASAIRTNMALYPLDTGARMLLVSDGNVTRSEADVLSAAQEAAAAGIPIDVLPIDYRLTDEVMVEALYAPTSAREGQTVSLRVVLRATSPTPGTLQLLHDEVPVDLSPGREGTGAPISRDDWTVEDAADADTPEGSRQRSGRYVAVKQIDLPMLETGANQFTAVFEPPIGAAGQPIGDTVSVNNRAEAFTLVEGRGRVLFVDNLGGDSGAILPRALSSRGIDLDIIGPRGLPQSLTQLQRYHAVIFQNVPADAISIPQHQMIARYVNNLGGGFAMVGGPQSFGAGGWTNTPVDRILPVDCQIPSQTVLPSGALVLVIDRSGSMGANVAGTNATRQQIANEASVLALQALFPQDLIGVVAFDVNATWVVPLRQADDQAGIARRIRSIQPGGGTHIYPGIVEAYNALSRLTPQEAAIRHIIVLTDGMDNPGREGNYVELVGRLVREGITLTTVGTGERHEVDTQLLTNLAQMGGGNFYHVVNPGHLPQIFIKEAQVIRKNLIREQEFTPQLVQTGSPVMTGVSAVPPLRGLVLTGEKDDPRVFTPMVGPEGEPVFAHWQVGLGRSAAFTSDATNRWATQWLNWGGYADFWARTVRVIARPAASREVDLVTTLEGEHLVLRLDAAGADADTRRGQRAGAFGNELRVRGSVLRPDGSIEEGIELEQVGPGLYEARVPASTAGNYIASLMIDQPDGERLAVFSGTNRPPGEELRRFEANLPLLRQVAEITGGRMLDPAADPVAAGLFSRDAAFESRSVRPLWRTLLVVLLVLILLDVACRRIAWDAVAIYNWGTARLRGIGEAMRGRQVESEATLAALHNKRRQTRERLGGGRVDDAEPAAALATARAAVARPQPDEPPPSPKRKFEAGPTYRAQGDFASAVDGARVTTEERAAIAAATREQTAPTDAGPTTSRLLAARKRAQERMNDDN
jgi:Ca-activated chloride channel family protein